MLLLFSVCGASAGVPATPRFFPNLIDHFGASSATYSQRYYLNDTAFSGPGSPIFMIMGGEGAIPPSTGFFYPWIVDVLAPRFNALVVEPEHRFFGESLPFGNRSYDDNLMRMLTPQQALADAAALLVATRQAHRCTAPGTAGYCPVITFGGSYPGWMSAMMRVRYPAVVDGAYSASAPMRFYAQQVSQYDYYRVVTHSAQRASSACPAAVRAALQLIENASTAELVTKLGLCEPLPGYMAAGGDAMLRAELQMVFAYTFANLNMANYPPGLSTGLTAACARFERGAATDGRWQSLHETLRVDATVRAVRGGARAAPTSAASPPCFDLASQMPSGANGTISCGDWSGCGTGECPRAAAHSPPWSRAIASTRGPADLRLTRWPCGCFSRQAPTAGAGTMRRAPSWLSKLAPTARRTCSRRVRGLSTG
eukprot:3426147-Prymnesium_polylepis.2